MAFLNNTLSPSILFSIIPVAIVSPEVYKSIMDGQCLHRIPQCGPLDSCTHYDIESLRYQIFGLSAALQAIAGLLLVAAFIISKRSAVYREEAYTKEEMRS